MSVGRISSWNLSRLSSYEQIQYHRERRTAAREAQEKMTLQAQRFANIKTDEAIGMGNIISRVAAKRLTGKLA